MSVCCVDSAEGDVEKEVGEQSKRPRSYARGAWVGGGGSTWLTWG